MVLEDPYTSQDEIEIQQMFLDHLVRVTPTDTFDEEITIYVF